MRGICPHLGSTTLRIIKDENSKRTLNGSPESASNYLHGYALGAPPEKPTML
jgi:hypothetical protein